MKKYFVKNIADDPTKETKLFVCTNEGLEIGDEIYGTREGGWVTVHKGEFIRKHKEKNYFFIQENGTEFMCYNCFKVVGQISGGAIWIQEGDQLEQSDIRLVGIPKQVVEEEDGSTTLYGDSNNIGVVIKCPTCKTFH